MQEYENMSELMFTSKNLDNVTSKGNIGISIILSTMVDNFDLFQVNILISLVREELNQ